MTAPKSELSVNPPGSYGDRFIKFISNVVKSSKEVAREKESHRQSNLEGGPVREEAANSSWVEAERCERDGATDVGSPQRKQSSMRSPSTERPGGATILPIVEEAAEGSTGSRSLSRNGSGSDSGVEECATVSEAARRSMAEDRGKQPHSRLSGSSFRVEHKYRNSEDATFQITAVS